MNTENLIKLAQEYRAKYRGKFPVDVVIINNGYALLGYSELPKPGYLVPGCYAVDADDRAWLAAGGDELKGCERWEPVCPEPDGVSCDECDCIDFCMARGAGEGE